MLSTHSTPMKSSKPPVTPRAETMKRVVIHRAGSYDRLQLETSPSLLAGRGEVVVDTRAIGVNYADCMVRMGLYASAKEFVGWPVTPGFESAGSCSRSPKAPHGLRGLLPLVK